MINADRLPATRLKRKAVVYVRQSTQAQVQMNLESQRRQYALVEEAKRRGFRNIEVIDSAKPVIDALRALPPIAAGSQWANFIKNHDEATLDKLTEEEREEVFNAFAPEPSMRIFGRGIRRRFPNMVNGDRRRLEHAYSLLFSLPGTPVVFYGEEIGLGDNQNMVGREAVRVPMHWSGEIGAGFTTAAESALPRPLMREGPFGYRSLNVEQQRDDPDSLLNWMERAIRARKEWPVFGWGEWEILEVMAAGDTSSARMPRECRRSSVGSSRSNFPRMAIAGSGSGRGCE